MGFKALVYAYVLGGITFLPLVVFAALFYALYTSVPVADPDPHKRVRAKLEGESSPDGPSVRDEKDDPSSTATTMTTTTADKAGTPDAVHDQPKPRKGWLTMRRTFEETATDAGYVTLVRGFLDARSKDPKRSRPKDMWYVVLKGKVLYLYEDEEMNECEAALELGAHDVLVYPEHQQDGELFAKRNAICLRPRVPPPDGAMPSITREMKLKEDEGLSIEERVEAKGGSERQREAERAKLEQAAREREQAREEALNPSTPWFMFVRSNIEMEDWYHALVHASDNPANSPMLGPFSPVFRVEDMAHLVETLDEQPDVIPMRWLNAIIGRLFFSFYRTQHLQKYIIGRLMKKIEKVKRPQFLSDIVVREVSVGNRPPMLSKPMLKELTKEGDAAVEVHMHFKGEIRITVEATATINLGARFKSYTVKLVLAAVLREMEGNLLVKVKRMPSNRIWYAFTQMPRMVLSVEPIVSDRQITWGMITSSIESRLREVIAESVVMPNMDDIAFFDSAELSHRGGIWPDAARKYVDPQPSSEGAPVGDTILESTSDAPPTKDSVLSLDEAHLSHPDSPPEATPDPRSNSAPPETGGLLATVNMAPGASPPNKTPNKRRTWLSTATTVTSNEDDTEAGSRDGDSARGRSTDVQDVGGQRSRSVAGKPEASNGNAGAHESFLSPSNRRSRSRGSIRSSGSVEGDSILDSITRSPSFSATASLRRSISRSSTANNTSETPTSATTQTSGFFSTLKSRAAAADKQQLAANAKDTIRKWGMNWGKNLRRESVGSDDAPDAGDLSDSGSAERSADPSGPTPTAAMGIAAQKSRESYADVRAKVEERRISRGGVEPTSPSSSTAPITIPGASPRARPLSGSLSPRALSPARLAEPASSSPLLVPSPAPIHTQPPQARTMMIPGIHASHRGEVMSMGYRPPTPTQPQQPASSSSSSSSSGPTGAPLSPGLDPKARVASVYSRLWKSPIAGVGGVGALNSTAAAAAPSSTSTATDSDAGDGVKRRSSEQPDGAATPRADQQPESEPAAAAAAASSSSPSSSPKSSPVPPPLPPRGAGLAAAALAQIAHRDEESRNGAPPAESGAATAAGAPAPPLPPRRTKASA